MSPTSHHHRRLACVVACALGTALVVSAAPAGAKGAGDLDRVGIRDSEDGVTLRLYEGSFAIGGGPDLELPERCFPNQEIQIQLSTRELATQVWFGVHRAKTIEPQGQVVGTMEDEPVAVVVARVPKGVDRVEMRFAGGSTDAMTPLRGGWVVLGSKLDKAPQELDRVPLLNQPGPSLGRITYFDEDDKRTTQRVATFGGYLDPECQQPPPPPPPLPDATGPPPADEPAARAAVEQAYTTVFSQADEDRDDRLAAIEDGESVRAASEKIAELYPEIGPTSLKIDEIRFLNETEAAVRFDILLDGNPITATTVGRALLIDGTWKIAKATYCELLGRGGVTC